MRPTKILKATLPALLIAALAVGGLLTYRQDIAQEALNLAARYVVSSCWEAPASCRGYGARLVAIADLAQPAQLSGWQVPCELPTGECADLPLRATSKKDDLATTVEPTPDQELAYYRRRYVELKFENLALQRQLDAQSQLVGILVDAQARYGMQPSLTITVRPKDAMTDDPAAIPMEVPDTVPLSAGTRVTDKFSDRLLPFQH